MVIIKRLTGEDKIEFSDIKSDMEENYKIFISEPQEVANTFNNQFVNITEKLRSGNDYNPKPPNYSDWFGFANNPEAQSLIQPVKKGYITLETP